MKNEFVAYRGELFIIEWYFDANGKSPVLDYYRKLPQNQKAKLFYLFYMLADTGKIRNEEKFCYEGNQIYAFKLAPDRFLCFFQEGAKVIVTNAFIKKTDKMLPREKLKALSAREDYKKRTKAKNYYD